MIDRSDNSEYAIQITNQSFSWGVQEQEDLEEEKKKKPSEDKKVKSDVKEPLIEEVDENDESEDVLTLG